MWRRGVRQILSLQATCLHAHGGVHRCPPSRVIAAHASTPAPALHQQPLQQVHRRSCASQPQQHQRKLVDASGGSFGQNALFAAAVVAAAAAGYTYVLRPAPAPKRPAPQPHDQGDAPASAVAEDPLVAAALQADGAVAAPLQARPLAAQQQQQQQEQEQRAAAPQAPAQARAPGQAPLPGPWVTEEVLAESLQRRCVQGRGPRRGEVEVDCHHHRIFLGWHLVRRIVLLSPRVATQSHGGEPAAGVPARQAARGADLVRTHRADAACALERGKDTRCAGQAAGAGVAVPQLPGGSCLVAHAAASQVGPGADDGSAEPGGV